MFHVCWKADSLDGKWYKNGGSLLKKTFFFSPFILFIFQYLRFPHTVLQQYFIFLKIMEKLYLNEPVMIFLIDLQLSCHGDWCCFSQIWEAEIEVQRDVASPEGQLPSLKSQPAAGLSCAPRVPCAYQSSLSWWCWTVNRKDVFSSLTGLLLCNLRVTNINSFFIFIFQCSFDFALVSWCEQAVWDRAAGAGAAPASRAVPLQGSVLGRGAQSRLPCCICAHFVCTVSWSSLFHSNPCSMRTSGAFRVWMLMWWLSVGTDHLRGWEPFELLS